jgi:lambda family phage portal protein
MNWLDNLIGWISPQHAAKREAWRQVLEEQRSYDAGNSGRLNANWSAINQSAEYTDRYSRDTVRARARDLERNSDMMNSVIGPFVRNVIGKGLVLQAETSDTDLNAEIEALWKIWCKKQNCDVTGTQSLNQMLRMAVRRKKVDGGVLFVKRYTSGGILPFKLQMFEVDELDSSQVTPKHEGNRVVGGIEYNRFNAPVGYWINQYTVDGFALSKPVYIRASDVIFYFSKRRPSQLREMSDMSQTITRIRDVNEFMVAVSVKQRIEACLSVFIKRSIPTAGLGRSNTDASGPRQSYDGKTLSPGMIKEMNVGDEVQVVNPQGQATDAASYTKLQQRMIGAGQGLSYEATSRDMSETTYSSARQAIIEDSMTYAEEDELLSDVMDEIYETFIISAVLAGKLRIPRFWNDKDKYFAHTFIKPPKPWIEPSKETQATKTALQSGQKTFKEIAAENGADWRKQIDDICEVLEYARDKHGIDLGGVILGQKKSDGLYEDEPEPEPEPEPGPEPDPESESDDGEDDGDGGADSNPSGGEADGDSESSEE